MRSNFVATALVAALTVPLAVGCKSTVKEPQPSLLFVQTAQAGSIDPSGAGGDAADTYQLRLENPGPSVVYFSDRPYRQAGAMTNAELGAEWKPGQKRGFASNAPNAALSLEDTNEVYVFELLDAKVEPDSVTYTARRLDQNGRFHFTAADGDGRTVPRQFGRCSLFIDNALNPYHMGSAAATQGSNNPYGMSGNLRGMAAGDPYGMASREYSSVAGSSNYDKIHLGSGSP